MTIWEKAIVAVAPNGSYKTKADHPALPMTLDELTKTARECLAAGASLFHLHLRDSEGRHLLDAAAYIEAMRHLKREAKGLALQVTAESAGIYSPEQQIDLIKQVVPEAVAVALCELIPSEDKVKAASAFFHWMEKEKINAQYILYAPEDLQRYNRYVGLGVIPKKSPILFVLGSYKTKTAGRPQDLVPYLPLLPPETQWMVCAFGPHEHACTQAAAALGGHIRVGFENNIYLKDGSLAPNNAALVRQAIHSLHALGRDC